MNAVARGATGADSANSRPSWRCQCFGPDGSVLDCPAYDDEIGPLHQPRASFLMVPPNPTLADTQQALADLVQVVCHFPFETPAQQSAWIAALLTARGQLAFDGPSPLVLTEANVRGSGKTLLCDRIAYIALGHPRGLTLSPRRGSCCSTTSPSRSADRPWTGR